jgi:nucleoside-diphosphate-sugar epimerase
VFTGTAAVYGSGARSGEDQPMRPATLLGTSKAAASMLLQTYASLHRMPTVELRLFTPYGPWEHPRRLIPQAILAALGNRDFPMSQGAQERDFTYVDDVVDALLRAGAMPLQPGAVFNIGSGDGIPIREVVKTIFRMIGTTALPLVGALPTRNDEITVMSANVRSAREVLSWQPRTSLSAGLEQMVQWVKQNREYMSQWESAHRVRAA